MSDDGPRCPECGGPIGQTATYCMHCSADLTAELEAADADDDGRWDDAGGTDESGWDDAGGTDAGGADDGGGTAAGGTAAGGTAAGGTDDGAWGSSDTGTDADGGDTPEPTYGPTQDPGDGSGSGATALSEAVSGDGEPMLDPDGIVDNSLTVAVGIGGGVFVGIVGTIALTILTGSAWGVLIGVLAWLGSTVYLVRRRTVQAAVAKSGYAVAAVLLLLPLAAFSPIADVEGGLRGRAAFFLASLLAVAVPAGFAAGLGYLASRFVPEDAGESPA